MDPLLPPPNHRTDLGEEQDLNLGGVYVHGAIILQLSRGDPQACHYDDKPSTPPPFLYFEMGEAGRGSVRVALAWIFKEWASPAECCPKISHPLLPHFWASPEKMDTKNVLME